MEEGAERPEGPGPLRLVPRCVVLGTGCKRGTSMKQIWSVAEEAMEREGLDPSAVCGLASIDLKSGEPGLCSLAEKLGVPFFTCTQERSWPAVPGAFTESEFVRQVTGVGSVCERAAVAACPGGIGGYPAPDEKIRPGWSDRGGGMFYTGII